MCVVVSDANPDISSLVFLAVKSDVRFNADRFFTQIFNLCLFVCYFIGYCDDFL